MKFIALSKGTDAFLMLPPEVKLQLLEVCLAKMEQQREERKITDYYYTSSGMGIVLFEAEDVDEWLANKNENPVLNYLDIEVYPLGDGFANLRRMVESLKAMGK